MKIKSIVAVCAMLAMTLFSFKATDKEVQSDKRFGGLALYTVRDAMKDARATLEKVAQAGYVNVESAGYNNGKFYNLSPADFKSLLDEMKLIKKDVLSIFFKAMAASLGIFGES